jgi:hypothetical protein
MSFDMIDYLHPFVRDNANNRLSKADLDPSRRFLQLELRRFEADNAGLDERESV